MRPRSPGDQVGVEELSVAGASSLKIWGAKRWTGLSFLQAVLNANTAPWQALCVLTYRCVLRLQLPGQLLLTTVTVSAVVGVGGIQLLLTAVVQTTH